MCRALPFLTAKHRKAIGGAGCLSFTMQRSENANHVGMQGSTTIASRRTIAAAQAKTIPDWRDSYCVLYFSSSSRAAGTDRITDQ